MTTPNAGYSTSRGGNYPDNYIPYTFSLEDLTGLKSYFGTPNVEIDWAARTPVTAETLSQAFNGSKPEITKLVHNRVVDGKGWWFALAPLRKMSMNQQVTIDTWDRRSMDLAPEETAPTFLRHRTETKVESLSRFVFPHMGKKTDLEKLTFFAGTTSEQSFWSISSDTEKNKQPTSLQRR